MDPCRSHLPRRDLRGYGPWPLAPPRPGQRPALQPEPHLEPRPVPYLRPLARPAGHREPRPPSRTAASATRSPTTGTRPSSAGRTS